MKSNKFYDKTGFYGMKIFCFISEEFSRLLSTISYIVVIFVIGLPMWWKTTEIHR